MKLLRGMLFLILSLCVVASADACPLCPPIEESYSDYVVSNYRNGPREDVILVEVPGDPYREALEQGAEDDEDNEVEPPAAPPVKTALDILAEKVDNLMSEVKSQQDRVQTLENERNKLIEKIDVIEQQTKANNLIFLNVRESKNENHRVTLTKVLQVIRSLRIRLGTGDIAMALRADSEDSTKAKPIVVKFVKFSDKMKVLAAKSRLRKSNVEIVSDFSELVNQRRQALVRFLLEKRRQGHNAYILYDKLMVDGVQLSLQELEGETFKDNTEVENSHAEDDQETTEADKATAEVDQETPEVEHSEPEVAHEVEEEGEESPNDQVEQLQESDYRLGF